MRGGQRVPWTRGMQKNYSSASQRYSRGTPVMSGELIDVDSPSCGSDGETESGGNSSRTTDETYNGSDSESTETNHYSSSSVEKEVKEKRSPAKPSFPVLQKRSSPTIRITDVADNKRVFKKPKVEARLDYNGPGMRGRSSSNSYYETVRRFTPKQRADIATLGCDGMLDINLPEVPSGLNLSILQHFDPRARALVVNNRTLFVLTWADVKDIFMLPHKQGRPVRERSTCDTATLKSRWRTLYKGLSGRNYDPSIDLLEQMMLNSKAGGDDFKRMFMLYILSYYLAPVRSRTFDLRYLKYLVDVDEVKNMDWCSFVLDLTCEAVAHFQDTVADLEDEEYKKTVFFPGCILLLLLSYINRTRWRDMPNPSEPPLVKAWTSEALTERVIEEVEEGKFGIWDMDAHTYPISKEEAEDQDNQDSTMITLHTPRGYLGEHELRTLFPTDCQKYVATLARDIHLVLHHHCPTRPKVWFQIRAKTQVKPDLRAQMTQLSNYLRVVVRKYKRVHVVLEGLLGCLPGQDKAVRGVVAPARAEQAPVGGLTAQSTVAAPGLGQSKDDKNREDGGGSFLPRDTTAPSNLLTKVRNSTLNKDVKIEKDHSGRGGVDFCGNAYDNTVVEKSIPESHVSDELTTPLDQLPEGEVYASELCRYLLEVHSSLPGHVLLIADFCTAPESAVASRVVAPYDDGVLHMTPYSFSSLNKHKRVTDDIIRCWARTLNGSGPTRFPLNRMCLDIVPAFQVDQDPNFLCHMWREWVTKCPRRLNDAILIYVPVRMDGHLFLLVINRERKLFHYLDSRLHQKPTTWKDAARALRSLLSTFLWNQGQEDGKRVATFKLDCILEKGKSSSLGSDVGIQVMYEMQHFNGAVDGNHGLHFKEVNNVEELRAVYCAEMVLSETNKNKIAILDAVKSFVNEKLQFQDTKMGAQ